MIFKLEYKNKDLDVARLEIITPGLVEKTIEGTEDPFRLIYKLDKSDKSGHFLTSSAEINIYETPEFNIDALKTSNETEIKVDYYINNIKKWTGFVIPDFFSKEIGKRSVVSMVASDRIGTLKGVTLTDLNAFVSLRTLAEQCLSNTGLSLPLNTMVDLEADAVNFFNVDALSQRLVDNKGRSISCYDILSSILVASNSIILQRNAEWYIVNKLQHELGQGKLYSNSATFTNWQDIIHNFSDVTVGARRTIIPVAASTGVYHEHGGGRLHPDNYDFSKGLTGWTSVGGFVAAVDNKEIKGFTTTSSGAVYTPVYGNATEKSYLINENEYIRNVNPKYIESEEISIPYSGQGSIEVEVNVNALAAAVYATPVFILPVIRIAVVATNGSDVLTLDYSGKFVTMPSTNPPVHEQTFEKGEVKSVGDIIPFLTEGKRVKGTLEVSNLEQYKLKIRIYGTQRAVYFHSVDLLMRNTAEAPKGTIFKTEQGSNYTKEHEIDTSIWGDYMTGGLNGYFYKYPIDDTSSLYSNGVLTSKWTDITDPGVDRSLLHHITTQRSRMFSQAHDLVSAEMDIRLFDPLSVYVACSKRYTLVSATIDFLRGRANLEIEEAVYQNLTKRDFIYSYFGDGETGVKSIGGISSGASGGGGLTSEQASIISNLSSWWKIDEYGNLYSDKNVYSTGELSAYGIGSGDSSGGGVNLLQAWTDYDATKDNWAVKAGLLVPFYTDATSRLSALEGGAALSLSPVGSGNGIANITKSGTVLTVTKANFAELDVNGKILSSQLPSYVDDVLEYVNLAAFPSTGETGKIYIAQDSNKTYRWSGTAYVEISASLALGETSSTAYRGDRGKTAYDHSQLTGNPHGTTFAQIVSRPTTITGYGITDAYTKTEVDTALALKLNKSVFDDLFEKVEVSTGVYAIKAKYNFYGVGEVSAYGLGSTGGGGGSYERLDAWVDYDSTKSGWVLSAFLGNELNSRVGNLEGGSALTVNTTGTGNAITSISKAGTVITATKGATFSLGNHLHTGVYEPVFTKNTAFNKNFGTTAGTVAEGNHTHTFASLTSKPTTLAGYEITDAVTTNTTQTITGTKTFRNWKIDSPEGALGIQSYRSGTGMFWPYGNALSAIRTGLGFGWYNTEWVIGNIRGGSTDSYGFGIGYKNADGNLDGEFRIAPGGLAYLNNVQIATVNSNVASATKLQTPRTIWGQSFDGTGNVTGALSGATTGSFTGTITSPLYQSGAYNWVSKTGGFHSGIDGQLTGGMSWYDGTGTSANIFRQDNLLVFSRGSNQSLTIDTSSNVSILGNTTTNRIILSSTAAEAHIEFSRPGINYLTAPLDGGINFITNGDSISALNSMLILSPNGNVGVGKGFTNNTTAITAQLHVRGNILSTGEITAYVASDRRLKHNITPLFSSLDIIDKLNPVSYYWNAKAKELNPMKSDSLDYGLIAQEVENVLPGVVHGIFDDKYKSIDYIKLIPIMIAAIKELKQKINKL